MGRKESPLKSTTPVRTAFFQDLRDLRRERGMTYPVMAEATGLAASTLSISVDGRKVAPWTTYAAFLSALGEGDLEYWRRRHAEADAEGAPVVVLRPAGTVPAAPRAAIAGGGTVVVPFNPLVLLPSPHTGTVAELLDWLEKVKNRSGVSFTALARATGMPRSTIASQFKRRTLPAWEIVAKVVAACGITDAQDLRTCSRAWAAVSDAETARRRGVVPALRSVDGAGRAG